jgi:hypothetical protein
MNAAAPLCHSALAVLSHHAKRINQAEYKSAVEHRLRNLFSDVARLATPKLSGILAKM